MRWGGMICLVGLLVCGLFAAAGWKREGSAEGATELAADGESAVRLAYAPAPVSAAAAGAVIEESAPLLRWMPSDTKGVVHVNMRELMDFMGADNPAMAAAMAASGFQGQQFLGFNPFSDLGDVCVGFLGEVGREGPGEVLIVAEGNLREHSVIAALRGAMGPGAGMQTFTHGGHALYRTGDFWLSFGGPSTMLAGTEAAVRKGLDRASETAHELGPSLTAAARAATLESGFWAAWETVSWLREDLRTAALGSELRPWAPMHVVESASLSGRLVGVEGMSLDLVCVTPDAGAGRELLTYLQDTKKRLLERTGVNFCHAALLQLTQLEAQGRNVRVSLKVTDSSLTRLWHSKMILLPEQRAGFGSGGQDR